MISLWKSSNFLWYEKMEGFCNKHHKLNIHNTTSLSFSKSWQFQQKMIVCELVRCVFCLFSNYPVEIAFLFSTKWIYNCTLVDNLFVFFFLFEEPSNKKTALSWLVDGLVGWLVWITKHPCVYAEELRCLKKIYRIFIRKLWSRILIRNFRLILSNFRIDAFELSSVWLIFFRSICRFFGCFNWDTGTVQKLKNFGLVWFVHKCKIKLKKFQNKSTQNNTDTAFKTLNEIMEILFVFVI